MIYIKSIKCGKFKYGNYKTKYSIITTRSINEYFIRDMLNVYGIKEHSGLVYYVAYSDNPQKKYLYNHMKIITRPAAILLPYVNDRFRNILYHSSSMGKNFSLYDDMIDDYYEYAPLYAGKEYFIREIEHMLSEYSIELTPKFVKVYEVIIEVV